VTYFLAFSDSGIDVKEGVTDLKKEFPTSNARFVYSKNELGYQEVLDRFESANEITIITFNISEKKKSLISALKKVGENCIINVITIYQIDGKHIMVIPSVIGRDKKSIYICQN
jgi:hypothetical protein